MYCKKKVFFTLLWWSVIFLNTEIFSMWLPMNDFVIIVVDELCLKFLEKLNITIKYFKCLQIVMVNILLVFIASVLIMDTTAKISWRPSAVGDTLPDAFMMMATHWLLSSAMYSSNNIDWPVHSLMLSSMTYAAFLFNAHRPPFHVVWFSFVYNVSRHGWTWWSMIRSVIL